MPTRFPIIEYSMHGDPAMLIVDGRRSQHRLCRKHGVLVFNLDFATNCERVTAFGLFMRRECETPLNDKTSANEHAVGDSLSKTLRQRELISNIATTSGGTNLQAWPSGKELFMNFKAWLGVPIPAKSSVIVDCCHSRQSFGLPPTAAQ